MQSRDRALFLDASVEEVLHHAEQLVGKAWREFQDPHSSVPFPDAYTADLLQQTLPRAPVSVHEALDDAVRILDASVAQARPRSLGFTGSSGLEIAVLADLLVQTYEIEPSAGGLAARAVASQALRWIATFVGYPMGQGAFTSGGLTSIVLALERAGDRTLPARRELGTRRQPLAIYCSSEARPSVTRAAELVGVGSECLRAIPIDPLRRMRPDALAKAIERDTSSGVTPLAVVATVGTISTGAIDPIGDISDVCRERGVWLHVDGSYGLAAASLSSMRSRFAFLSRANSISIDAHKWLYMPKSCGILLFRDLPMSTEAPVPTDALDITEPIDPSIDDDRPFQALKVWLAFRAHGADQFRNAIERNIEQARLFYRTAQKSDDFEVLEFPPELGLVPFRHAPFGVSEVNAHNRALAGAIRLDRRIDVSATSIDGDDWLRVCFANFRTTSGDVRTILDVARELGAILKSEGL